MLRLLAIALMASLLAAPTEAQTPATSVAKPAAKKPAQKAKIIRAPATAAPVQETGPCDTGVISAIGDIFTVQKMGFTVFGNERTEVPVNWGFDDLVFARAKAIGGARIRRMTYPDGTFEPYYHPKSNFIRADSEKLENIIKRVAGSAGCERYLVVIRVTSTTSGTNQTINGMGVMSIGTSLLSTTMIYDSVMTLMYDGQSFEKRSASMSFKRTLENLAPSNATGPTPIETSAYPAVAADAANSVILRDAARSLLTKRIDRSLLSYFATDTQ